MAFVDGAHAQRSMDRATSPSVARPQAHVAAAALRKVVPYRDTSGPPASHRRGNVAIAIVARFVAWTVRA
jgi:hypothetical protein